MINVLKTFLVLVLSVAAIGQTLENSAGNQGSLFDNKFLDNVDPSQKKEILQAFESSLLNLFSLKTRPRPKKGIEIPQYMIDLYKTHTSDPDSLSLNFNFRGKSVGLANTARSFYHSEDADGLVDARGCGIDNCARIWFNVSHIPSEETLTAAEFRVFLDKDTSAMESDSKKKRRLRMEVHQVIKPVVNGQESFTRLIDVKHVSARRNASWVSFDAHPAVLKWKNTPSANHGLEIRILPYNNHPSKLPIKHVRLRRSATDITKWQNQRPLLVTYTNDNRDKLVRTKRSKKNKKPRKNRRTKKRRNKMKRQCRRKPLYIDFTAVGWTDWIFAPPGYQAYYCSGECEFPFPEHMNATNHAIVQDLVNSIDPKAAPKPCCVPTELSPISLLYVDEYEKVILKSYQDMVVEGCGCR